MLIQPQSLTLGSIFVSFLVNFLIAFMPVRVENNLLPREV